MANAKICDRCKKYYEFYNYDTDPKNRHPNGITLIADCNGINRHHWPHKDLCPECMKDFSIWFSKFGEEVPK